MTARQHPLHRDSPAHVPRPQARGTPPVQSGVAAAQFGVGGDGQAALGAGGLVRFGGAQSHCRVWVVLRLAPGTSRTGLRRFGP